MKLVSIEQEFVILMKKRTADSDGSDDIEAAFKVFDTKNDGYETHKNIFNRTNYFVVLVLLTLRS